MPAPYTEPFVGEVARVWPGDERHPTQVILRDELRNTTRYYTWSEWAATFCRRAEETHQRIAGRYSVTAWGNLIDDVDFATEDIG